MAQLPTPSPDETGEKRGLVPDLTASLLSHLEHAAACYGADLGLPLTEVPPRTPEAPQTPDSHTTGRSPAPTQEPHEDPAPALADLHARLAPCTECNLHRNRTNLVQGEGDPDARVMFVGEAPGQVEDETGRPFVGRSGQLLDRIIENAMGMRREDVFIANINKCRPPGNRDPEPLEIAACLPWLRAQIEIIKPEVIVTLGRVAAWNLLGVAEPMGRLRGRKLSYEDTPVVATWHPAYLLRNPAAKAQTWDDVKRVNRLLGNPEVPTPGG